MVEVQVEVVVQVAVALEVPPEPHVLTAAAPPVLTVRSLREGEENRPVRTASRL